MCVACSGMCNVSNDGLTSEQTLALILPPTISHGTGGYLFDAKGNVYIDMISAEEYNLLGYGHPRIAAAVARQAARYTNLGLAGPEYSRLLELLTRHVPSAEAMHLVRTGCRCLRCCSAAHRHLTGRDLILHRGYHGTQDWYMASIQVPGVPASHRAEINTLADLEPATLAYTLEANRGRVAAVLIDPMVPPIPTDKQMQEIAHLHSAGWSDAGV